MENIKVEQLQGKNGPVKNQFIIRGDGFVCFQSYDSVIVKIEYPAGTVFLDSKFWNFSMTTGKYRNIFLGETKKETEKKIKAGEYILTNLN